jgi:hypothetical protein
LRQPTEKTEKADTTRRADARGTVVNIAASMRVAGWRIEEIVDRSRGSCKMLLADLDPILIRAKGNRRELPVCPHIYSPDGMDFSFRKRKAKRKTRPQNPRTD